MLWHEAIIPHLRAGPFARTATARAPGQAPGPYPGLIPLLKKVLIYDGDFRHPMSSLPLDPQTVEAAGGFLPPKVCLLAMGTFLISKAVADPARLMCTAGNGPWHPFSHCPPPNVWRCTFFSFSS